MVEIDWKTLAPEFTEDDKQAILKTIESTKDTFGDGPKRIKNVIFEYNLSKSLKSKKEPEFGDLIKTETKSPSDIRKHLYEELNSYSVAGKPYPDKLKSRIIPLLLAERSLAPTNEEMLARKNEFSNEMLKEYARNLMNGVQGYDRATFNSLVSYAQTLNEIDASLYDLDEEVLKRILGKIEPTKEIITV